MPAQLSYSRTELLESDPSESPLIAGGVRCHGGFNEDGHYVSPRTRFRWPAIRAWQEQHKAQFGTDLVEIPLESWPSHYPNVAQAKHLIANGVTHPMKMVLTRIGTVEGFGASIRNSALPDLERAFDESVEGTATAHLEHGLFEAHARDEAGFGSEGGHKQMWFAARDIAFPKPPTDEEVEQMMAGFGFPAMMLSGNGPSPEIAQRMREQAIKNRMLPEDIDFDLELQIARMARLLLIEISAFHAFAWAHEVLSDTELIPGNGGAANLVSYIAADETPHVEYLKVSLAEMRDRTFVGASGRKYPGKDMIGTIWDASVESSLGLGRLAQANREVDLIEQALEGHPRRDDLLEEFHALGEVSRAPDGSWSRNEPTA
jgi:hypothetical protein